MAVYQAWKIKNDKVSKKNLISFSHLKPVQWNLLDKTWEKLFPPEKLMNFNKIIECNQFKKNKTEDVINLDCKIIEENKECDEKVIETYEMWKDRILKKAYKSLEKENNMEIS